MAGDKLSAKEAAVIAQARADLEKKPAVEPGVSATAPVAGQGTPAEQPAVLLRPAAPVARAAAAPPPAAIQPVAAGGAAPVQRIDPAEHAALLMAAARAETERRRRRHKTHYLWIPAAVMAATALWTLLWMWQKL